MVSFNEVTENRVDFSFFYDVWWDDFRNVISWDFWCGCFHFLSCVEIKVVAGRIGVKVGKGGFFCGRGRAPLGPDQVPYSMLLIFAKYFT